jgi:hypothetical protein
VKVNPPGSGLSPAVLPNHPDDGHDHHFACVRCGVNPPESSPAVLRVVEAAREVLRNVSPDDDDEGAFLDYLVPFEQIEALREALDNR